MEFWKWGISLNKKFIIIYTYIIKEYVYFNLIFKLNLIFEELF
jgi:hypothetical protein